MSLRSKIIPAIQWYEGMMLAPHHFQQQALRAHQIEALKFKLNNPFLYGISSITVDEAALPKGHLSISDIEALTPDGEAIQINHVLQISLSEYRTHQPSEITAWLGIAPWHNDISPLNKENPRYEIKESEPVASYDDKSNLIPVSRLIPLTKLYLAHGADPTLVSIPILKLKCAQNVFELERFTPPCFSINHSQALISDLKTLVFLCRKKETHLLKKYESLLGTKKEPSTFFVLNKIREIIPILEMIVSNDTMHPFEAYKHLCYIAGMISCLRKLDPVVQIPSYDHDNIEHSFSILWHTIHKEIIAITETYRYIPFDMSDNVFSLYINPTSKKILVSISFKEPLQTKVDWINNTIIVSDSEIDTAIEERITGAKRHILSINEYPEDLFDVGDLLIEITIDDRYVFENKKLILFNPISNITPESICWCVKN